MGQIKGLSKKETEIIAWLESYGRYFFTIEEIEHFFEDKKQRYNYIQRLLHKERIIKINRRKYYLIPIRARTGGWAQDSFILADEIMDGEDYFIGGWAAANYWRLTDQIPFWTEVFSTKRQGRKRIFNTGFIFRRTTPEKIKKAVVRKVDNHTFRVMSKKEMKKWMKSR
jgi:predicted transcriptional regulator of viral defense system